MLPSVTPVSSGRCGCMRRSDKGLLSKARVAKDLNFILSSNVGLWMNDVGGGEIVWRLRQRKACLMIASSASSTLQNFPSFAYLPIVLKLSVLLQVTLHGGIWIDTRDAEIVWISQHSIFQPI